MSKFDFVFFGIIWVFFRRILSLKTASHSDPNPQLGIHTPHDVKHQPQKLFWFLGTTRTKKLISVVWCRNWCTLLYSIYSIYSKYSYEYSKYSRKPPFVGPVWLPGRKNGSLWAFCTDLFEIFLIRKTLSRIFAIFVNLDSYDCTCLRCFPYIQTQIQRFST